MTRHCPPCHGNCSQGRRCTADRGEYREHPAVIWLAAVLVVIALAAIYERFGWPMVWP